jgi:chromosome segregation ATPase
LIIERKQREQVEDFRLQLESNLKEKEKAYSRQLRELEKSTQLKRTDYSKNEENLNQLLRKYQEEIKDMRKENANLRGFYDSIEQQSKDLESRY